MLPAPAPCKTNSSNASWRSISWNSSKAKFKRSKSTTDTAEGGITGNVYNYRAVKEYKAQSSTTLQECILNRIHLGKFTEHVFCETVFASVLIADISGFTKLASTLEVEDLKRHINNFFTLLLGNIIRKHKGDVVKFCGDAVLIMWTAPLNAAPMVHRTCVENSTECGLDMLATCGRYDSGEKDAPVSLRLHCGMSAGELHYMSLGSKERMEFLISGPLLADMGVAASNAKTGEICVSPTAFSYLYKQFEGFTTPHGSVKITKKVKAVQQQAPTCSSFLRKKHAKIHVDTSPALEDKLTVDYAKTDNAMRSAIMNALPMVAQPKDFKISLARYVHESARPAIANKTSEHIAELRLVTTMFIQLHNLDDDFNTGRIDRPQQAMLIVLDSMKRLQGSLRQYVVDDKGCVMICCFGVPGFSTPNDSVRAITAAFGIRSNLTQFNIECRIGIAQGTVFCGYVGSSYRHEYSVMGSSVNLAARLMGKCDVSQILVDSNVHFDARDEFVFVALPKVKAKGYDAPVAVFSPLKHVMDNSTFDDIHRRVSVVKQQEIVGRRHELSLLGSALRNYLISTRASINHELFHTEATMSITDSPCSRSVKNKFVIVGGPGYGKTALINELIRSNADLLLNAPRLNCHLASMMEPYEMIRQLFKVSLGHDVLPVVTSNKGVEHSISNDDGDFEPESTGPAVSEDYEQNLLEDMYTAIEARVKKYLSNLSFDYVSHEDVWEGGASVDLGDGGDIEDDEAAIYFCRSGSSRASNTRSGTSNSVFHVVSKSRDPYPDRSSVLKSVITSSDGKRCNSVSPDRSLSHSFSDQLSAATPDGINVAAQTKVFGILDVLPLLRICLGTNIQPSEELLCQFTTSGREEMICSLLSEILKHFIYTSKSKTVIVEDLQWCDPESFDAILHLLAQMDAGIFLGSMRPVEQYKNSKNRYVRATSFEGTTQVNGVDDISHICDLISLGTLTRNNVRTLIEITLGSSLLADEPNILSDQSISNILAKSNGGVAGLVVDQVKQFEVRVSKARYGASSPSTGNRDGMQQFDRLSHENKIVLKMASVCGTGFTVFMLNLTLDKMGYGNIASHLEKSLVEIEEKGIIKRVFTMPDRADSTVGMSYLSRARSASTRRMASQNSGATSSRDSKAKSYTFLDKAFRENVYSLMLEGQRQAVHAIIARNLAEAYESAVDDQQVGDAEALAFHFSRARNLEKEIKYTEEAAMKSHQGFLTLTAYCHYHQLFKLTTCQRSVDQVIEDCCLDVANSQGDPFSRVFKSHDFGRVTANNRYLPGTDLSKLIRSKCSLIPTFKMCVYVAHMSILSYKLGELTRSHNLSRLASHIKDVNASVMKLPVKLSYRNTEMKWLFGSMFFYQGDLCLMRGLLGDAEMYFAKSLALIPQSDTYSYAQTCCGMATVSLFTKGMAGAQEWYKKFNVKLIRDRKDVRFSYVHLHRGVLTATTGDFHEAEQSFLHAATRTVLRQDDSPLRLQIENILSWMHFVSGHPQLVHDRLKMLAEYDLILQKIWSNELLIVIHIVRGQFFDAYHLLSRLKRLQRGHYGLCYYYALYGFLSVCEKIFLHDDLAEREKCINAVIYAGDQLILRSQLSPIGFLCLFFVAYSSQSILYHESSSNVSPSVPSIFRRGGGCVHRLRRVAKKTLQQFRNLVKTLPFLQPLEDVLLMQESRVAKVPVKSFSVDYFHESPYDEKYKQFVFGLLFWHLEKVEYMRTFALHIRADGSAEDEISDNLKQRVYLSQYGVPSQHPLFHSLNASQTSHCGISASTTRENI